MALLFVGELGWLFLHGDRTRRVERISSLYNTKFLCHRAGKRGLMRKLSHNGDIFPSVHLPLHMPVHVIPYRRSVPGPALALF